MMSNKFPVLTRNGKIILAIANLIAYVIMAVGSWHIGSSRAADTAAEQTLARIKATCDDEQAPTQLGGQTYMCVSKPRWNQVLEYVFQQGAQAGYKKGKGET